MKELFIGAAMTAMASAAVADEVILKEMGLAAGESAAKFQLLDDNGLAMNIKSNQGFFYDTIAVACKTLTENPLQATFELVRALPLDLYTDQEFESVGASADNAIGEAMHRCASEDANIPVM